MKWLRALVVVGLLASVPASAQLGQWRAYDFFNLTGGLNDAADPTAIALTEASDLQNVLLSTSGGIEKRSGFSQINSSASCGGSAFTGLTFYRQADGDRFLVGVCTNDTIQKMDYGSGTSGPDGTWDAITGSVSLTVNADDLADFATVQDVLVIEDGIRTTDPITWTGTGNASVLTAAPNASMVEFHKRILWVAGRSDARSRVDFSNLDDYTTWTATDFLLVETDDNQVITGLRSALDCLYVFKTESIWRICGSDRDNLTLEQMVRGVGAASNQSITVINNRFLFTTHQGDVAVYDGGITVQIISSKIEGTLAPTNINLSRIEDTVAVAFDDGTGDEDYYLSLSLSGSGTHNLLLVFDTLHQAWTKFSGISANAMTSYEVGTQQRAIAFSDYSGYVNRYPSGTSDAGTSISAYYQSGHLRLDIPTVKTFREFQLMLRQEGSQSITFERRVDFAGSGTASTISLAGSGALWDSATWDSSSYADIVTAITRVPVNESGDFILWRISDNSTNNPFLLRGLRLWAEPEGRLGGGSTE